ncbi:hypothetical protein [Sulfitobacter sp.]|uniref:hypothetical protein n=1 Tax=Sulfitobacter sp. TaxID=1903071 RepID=UPI003EF4FFE2
MIEALILVLVVFAGDLSDYDNSGAKGYHLLGHSILGMESSRKRSAMCVLDSSYVAEDCIVREHYIGSQNKFLAFLVADEWELHLGDFSYTRANPPQLLKLIMWGISGRYSDQNVNGGTLPTIFQVNHTIKNQLIAEFYRQDIKFHSVQICSGLCLSDFPRDVNSIISGFDGSTSLYKGGPNPYNTKASYEKRTAGNDHHPERPSGHILLSIKVLSGLGFILCGLGGFNHTLAQSGRLDVSASGQRSVFYCLVMLAGTYLIAANIYASGSPCCKDDYGNPGNYHINSECF